jgi:hypothetical protein
VKATTENAVRPRLTEKAFMAQVIKLARLCGWKVAHFRPAQTRPGRWVTAVQGDGKGFLDLVLVHPKLRQTLFVELKTDTGKLSREQNAWLAALLFAGQKALIWRPKDWPIIEQTLFGGT